MIRKALAAATLVTALSQMPGAFSAQGALAPGTVEATIAGPALDLSSERYQVDMSLRVPPFDIFRAFHFLYVTVDVRGGVGDGKVDLDVYRSDDIVCTVSGTYDQAGAFHLTSERGRKRTAIDGTFDGIEAQLTAKATDHRKPNPTDYTAQVLRTRWDSQDGQRVLAVEFAYWQKGKEKRETRTAYLLPDERRVARLGPG